MCSVILFSLILIAGVGFIGLLFCLFSVKQYHDNLEDICTKSTSTSTENHHTKPS